MVDIIGKSFDDLKNLKRYDLDLKYRTAKQQNDKFIVSGVLNDNQIVQIKNLGYSVEIVSNLSVPFKERLKEISESILPVKDITDFEKGKVFGGYLNTEQIENYLKKFRDLYPNIITTEQLPNQTIEKRITHFARLKINDNNHNESKIGVLFTGGVHAREWGGSDICIHLLIKLLDSYKNNLDIVLGNKTFTATQIKKMIEKIDLFIFPNVNPDGKIYSQTYNDPSIPKIDQNNFWRKNRNPALVPNPAEEINGEPAKNHLTGVDINRNFDFLWESGIATMDPVSGANFPMRYRGSAPFSEPETQNVKYLFDHYKNIKYFVDIHSWSETIVYNWGDDSNQTQEPKMNFKNPTYDGKRGNANDSVYGEYIKNEDEQIAKKLANRMSDALFDVRGKKYSVSQSATGMYVTSGTSDDYAFSRHFDNLSNSKIYGFTIEFGPKETAFVPPYHEMKNIIDDVCAALIELCIQVTN